MSQQKSVKSQLCSVLRVAFGIALSQLLLRNADCSAIDLEDQADTHYNKANELIERGRLDEGIREYRKAIAINPKLFEAHNNLGTALLKKGLREEAVKEFHETIKIQPDHAKAYCNLGMVLHEDGLYEEAIKAYRKAIQLEPGEAQAYSNLGQLFAEQGSCNEAIPLFQKALEIEPEDWNYHVNIGVAYSGKGLIDKAIKSYRKAIELQPGVALTYTNLGINLAKKGLTDEAIASYRQALQADPNDTISHRWLGEALRSNGEYREAISEIGQAQKLEPVDIDGKREIDSPYWQEWINECQRLIDLENQFDKFLEQNKHQTHVRDRLLIAEIADSKRRYVLATQLREEAAKEDPGLLQGRQNRLRYTAARGAVLAAAGQSLASEPKIDDKRQVDLRAKALLWLKDELQEIRKVEKAENEDQAEVAKELARWTQSADLASIRDSAALSKMSEAESLKFQAFWKDVNVLLKEIDPNYEPGDGDKPEDGNIPK